MTNQVLFYHYSDKKFDELKSSNKQGRICISNLKYELEYAKLTGAPGSYDDSISLFFDPVPLDIIGDLFKGKNDVWKNGKKLYEYTVNVEDLEPNLLFSVVETPADTTELDKTVWIETDDFLLRYLRNKYKRKLISGETNTGIKNLLKQAAIYKGKTREAYIKASKRKDFDDTITKYAAYLPHVMLYPESGRIKISSSREVTVGRPNMLYHGSGYKNDKLMPGIKYTGEKVNWDTTESNEWLYFSSEKDLAIAMGITGAIDIKFKVAHASVLSSVIDFTLYGKDTPTVSELENLKVYLYTVSKIDPSFIKVENKYNNCEVEFKTKETISYDSCIKIDMRTWLKTNTINIKMIANEETALQSSYKRTVGGNVLPKIKTIVTTSNCQPFFKDW